MTRSPIIEKRPQNLRGTNYIASIAYGTDKVLGMLPFTGGRLFYALSGHRFFDARHNDDELRALASYGINNIRMFGSFWAWVLDAPAYRSTLATIVSNCRNHGISITYVLWSTTGTSPLSMYDLLQPHLARFSPGASNWPLVSRFVWAHVGGLALKYARLTPDGEPWHLIDYDEPGNILFAPGRWDINLDIYIHGYLRDVALIFGQGVGRNVLASYDLFNEPDTGSTSDKYALEARLHFIAHTQSLLTMYHGLARSLLPPCTIGWAFMSDYSKGATRQLRNMGVALQYLSSHAYEYNVQQFRTHIRDAMTFSTAQGLPYVCSEFWQRGVPLGLPYPRSIAPYLQALSEAPMGGQIWGLLAFNLFDQISLQPIDGFITPERNQFTPLVPKLADSASPHVWGGLAEPQPWPAVVRVELTPPASGDVAAVRAWTRSRSLLEPQN